MKKLFVALLMLITMSASAQWVEIDTITYGSSITSIGNNIFVGAIFYDAVRFSSNGGTNWVNISGNNYFRARGMSAIGNTIFAGTNTGIYSTTNLGLNWTLKEPNFYTLNMKVYNNTIIVGTTFGANISTDNGATWLQTSLNNLNIRGLFATSTKILAGAREGGVYLSTNGGYNFVNIGMNDKHITSVGIVGNTYLAGTDTAGIYTSTDGGTIWNRVNTSSYPLLGGLEVAVSGSNAFYATTYGCFVSNDNGITWNRRNEGTPGNPLYIYIANGYVYMAGMRTYRRPLAELVGVQNISTEVPSAYSLSQNYPNPFNPTTNIRYAIPKSGMVKLVVFDALGREVETLVNKSQQAGTYEASFNGSALTSGVYFYKLSVGDFTDTKRMLIIK